ncbi:uncharacterized mitochondrial protein-like protein [Tanacetum coccineum]
MIMRKRELGEGYSFTKKKCFVCGSLSHLIKDCDYYEKKMAREAEVKRVVNTGNGVAKPVWTNANRINHSNKFVPRSVQLNAGRPKFNSVRPNINTGRTDINSGRPKVNTVSSNINTVRSRQPIPNKTSNNSSPKRPQMNQMNQRRDFSKSYSSVISPFAKTTAQMSHSNVVIGSWGSAVKTSASYNWSNTRPNFNYNSGPTFVRTGNDNGPQGRPKPVKAWDLKNSMGGSVTYWMVAKLYISGKGRIRVDKPNVKGVGYRWMFDIDYLTDSMNYIPVSLENQANPHAGASEVTNSAGTSQTPSFNASKEKDEDVELIVVPSTVRNTEGKAESRKSSTNSKKEEILTELQQEKKAFSTDTSEDNPKIQAFRRELEEIALKHLGKVSENTTTSTTSVNTGGDNDFKQSSPRNEHRNQSQKINNNCLFACFSISWDPKKIVEALQDASWVQAMHKRTITVQASYHVGFIVDLPHGMKVIGTKWVYRNKRDERGVVVRNKARLVAQGYTQEEVYVDDIIFGSTNKSWCDEFEALMKSRFQMSSMGELTFFLGLQVKQNKGGIFISQDKYVAEILKKFDLVNVKAAITPMETKVPLTKDEEAIDVDVTPKTSHLNDVKRIFKYLKGKPHLGLWYPRESPFDLEAFSDSDYGGSNLDRKSTTGGCQFLGQAFSWNQDKVFDVSSFSANDFEYSNEKQTPLSGCEPDQKDLWEHEKGTLLRSHLLSTNTSHPHRTKQRTNAMDAYLSSPSVDIKKLTAYKRLSINQAGTYGECYWEKSKMISRFFGNKECLFDKGRMIQEEERLRERSSLKLDFQEEVDHRTGSKQVSTVGAKKSTPSPDKGQRAGKAPMIIEETPKKSKEQILQEEASLDEAIRLDSLQKEEEAKQIHLDSLLAQRIAEKEELNEQQKKRKAQVQFEAQHYTNEDWDLIREKIEANAELSNSC